MAKKNLVIKTRTKWASIYIISFLTFLILIPALRFGFVNLDDNFYVTDNLYIRHISVSNIKYFFTSFHHGVYAPVQYLTYMLIYSAVDYHPALYHFINILFYILSCVMVYLLVFRIQKDEKIAIFSTLLFLLSPVNIDTAVWIAELKNSQSLFFFLISFYLYILFREQHGNILNNASISVTSNNGIYKYEDRKGNPYAFYALSLIAFVLGLLVKPPGATLLIMMFVYDVMKEYGIKDSIKRLLPYFLILIPFIITYMIGQSTIGSYHGLIRGSIWAQIKTVLSVIAGIFNYPGKLILPVNLSISYPIDARITNIVFALSIFLIIFFILGMRFLVKHDKDIAFWLIWYFVNMLPYYGIVAMPFFANWYLYIPSIGLYTAIVSAINRLNNKKFAYGFLIFFIVVFGFLGFRRQFIWKSDVVMWKSSLNAVGDDPYVLRNLAISYFKDHEVLRGIEYGSELLKKTPDFVMMKYLIGKGYAEMNDYNKALEVLNNALNQLTNLESHGIADRAVMPGLGDTPYQLMAMIYTEIGDIKLSLGKIEEAIDMYKKAIASAPYVHAYDQLAFVYVKTDHIDDARRILNEITILKPDEAEPWRMLGYITAKYYGDNALAVRYFKKSLEIEPHQRYAYDIKSFIKTWETNKH